MRNRKFLLVAPLLTITTVVGTRLAQPAQATVITEKPSTEDVKAFQNTINSGESSLTSAMIALGVVLALLSSASALYKVISPHHASLKAADAQQTQSQDETQSTDEYTTSDNKQNIPTRFIEQAYSSYKQGDTQKALAEFDRAILIHPQNAYLYTERANFRRNKLEDRLGALEDYTQAIRIHPENPLFYLWRSQLYYEIGDKLKAMTDHNTAIRLAPEDTMYHFFPTSSTSANAGRR